MDIVTVQAIEVLHAFWNHLRWFGFNLLDFELFMTVRQLISVVVYYMLSQ